MDELDKSQKMQPVPTFVFPNVLSPDQLDREIRKVWKICIVASFSVPILAFVVSVLLFLGITDLKTVGLIAYPITAIVLMTFGLAFVIPATLTSIRRVSATVRMAYTGLQTNQQTTESIKAFLQEARPIVEVLKNQVQDGFLEKIEGHLKVIADRVKKDTTPLPTGRRPSIEV
jgi:hypothetical protein